MAEDLSDRMQELERRIAALEAVLREAKGTARHAEAAPSAPPSAPPSATPPATPRPMPAFKDPPRPSPAPKRDWEALIGRYGTLVLATVAIVTAVGTFIGWAIANGLLGPTVRVALGLVAAAGLAVAGLRLRKRERSFGATLLGLALAVVHVCAWGAGPSLHLVPNEFAFALAALASVTLAVLARVEEDQPLWCVGFAGAAIAPFVTSSRSGQLVLLALYGLGVLASSGRALGDRPWRVAGRLFVFGATLYVVALMLGAESDYGPRLAVALPIVVAYVGVLPWTSGELRRDRLRPLGALAGLAALRTAFGGGITPDIRFEALLIGGAGVAWLLLVDQTRPLPDANRPIPTRAEGDWVDAGLIPASFVFAALMALDMTPRENGLVLVGVTLALLVAVWRHYPGHLRDAAVVTTVLSAAAALVQLEQGKELLLAGNIAALGATCWAGAAWRPSRSWTVMGCLLLTWGIVVSIVQLADRPAYGYMPLLTPESAVSAVVCAALFVAWRFEPTAEMRPALLGAAVTWAFVWIHQEITFAFNATASTLMRVLYYAATSVAAVWVGRARKIALLRNVGLGLAVLAAATALYSARNLIIGARIVADLVAAGFLLAIAYWYRRPGSKPSPEDSAETGPQRSAV